MVVSQYGQAGYDVRMSQHSFQIDVETEYLPEQSSPEDAVFTFAYHITITNTGDVPAQLISRCWNINDASGVHQKVKGLGVVGYQPLLKPGQNFHYSSGCRLSTPTGTMHGHYFFVSVEGERFEVDIPIFVLDALSYTGDNPSVH